jgi:leucyl/phenylalanyl-tRNA--protein transferase
VASAALPHPDAPQTAAGLLDAYRHGAFPMASSRRGKRVNFYIADPRAIVPIAEGERTPYRAARSVRALVRRGAWRFRTDTAFREVITACADSPRAGSPGTWINDWIIEAYVHLHRLGHAHSVEAWHAPGPGCAEVLVGGLYGVHLGAAFFGESMFHRPGPGDNASKACLAVLVDHLVARGFTLLDTQFINDHMRRQGAVEITLAEYRQRLGAALDRDVSWQPWADPFRPGASPAENAP